MSSMPAFDTSLTCSGCGETASGVTRPLFKCPNALAQQDIDHVLMPAFQDTDKIAALVRQSDEANAAVSPFVKYRALLYPYRVAMSNGMSDGDYTALVTQLDNSIEEVGGTGFRETPLLFDEELNTFVKDETANVAQSHKARHLFNVMTYLLVLENNGADMRSTRRLAVASCGNAGLAAATIARAANWPIDVCIPEEADPVVVEKLTALGANIVICPRGGVDVATPFGAVGTAGMGGDPCVSVFKALVEQHGSIPFSVQGSECGLAAEGGQTLAWEILEGAQRQKQTTEFDNLFVQVGGGALGAGLSQGFQRALNGEVNSVLPGLLPVTKLPQLMCVQAEGNAPLGRAFNKIKETGETAVQAAGKRSQYMFPWDQPHSLASGILDDETYDWVELVQGMQRSGGDVVLVDDATVSEAKDWAQRAYNVGACYTGAAGLAGALKHRRGGGGALSGGAPSIVILTGSDRRRGFASSAAATPTGSWVRSGVTYRALERDYDPEVLFNFNKTHGSTPLNFIPDEPVRAHFSKLKTGETTVWGAFTNGEDGKEELVGFISGEVGGGYWLQTGGGPDSTCFINEFVVQPGHRGKRIGVNLTAISVDAKLGIFALDPRVTEMYTTVHVDNVPSRTAFVKGGYSEVMTYSDAMRDRNTTVLKFASTADNAPRGNAQTMRVVGVQSGNAVDGIDVGIFDFDPLTRSTTDPRALAGSINYRTIANKTFPFTPEERQYVLGLRAMRLENGNEYAEGNYKFGEWCADRVNSLLAEAGVDPSEVALIGSHGQTVSGHPHWEFGDVSVIAQRTGITVAGDFRPADVAAGGNGTPCTCTYDSIMLRPKAGTEKWRIAINIGGTSSVTFCPPWPTPGDAASEAHVPVGLDPGLGVFFMDLTARAIDPKYEYDPNGDLARSGTANEGLLSEFLTYKYYQQANLPIGVGPDDFPETLWMKWRTLAQSKGVSDIDLIATFTELTARQIAMACARFGGPHITNGQTDDVLLRGGVCQNSFFVERLRANMEQQLNVAVPRISTLADLNIDEDSWENAMYAMFGYLCYNNVYNFVPSCTGASRPVVGGRIAPGENFHSVRLTRTPM